MTTVGTEAEDEYARAKTSVWWDIENCEVPRGWDAHAIAQNVCSALLKMDYGGPVSISAYGDTNLIPRDVQQALSSTGVGLNHVPAGVKDASDKKILVDMCLWAVDNPAPANFMLISGDRDFSYALHQLRMRRYNILLAQPPHASVPLVAAAKNVWLWTSLALGGPPLTRGESPRLVNNGGCNVSNNEVSKHPVSEQAQSSKPTDSTSDPSDTKDHKTREKRTPGGLPQETRSNMPQSSTGATCESVNAQLSDKRHISQAAVVVNKRDQASVSTKPIKEGELVEPIFCQVCQISWTSKESYSNHIYGKRHRNNWELLSSKTRNMSGRPVEPLKEVLEKQKKKATNSGANQNADYICSLCNVSCSSQIDLNCHLRGQKHIAMLSQSRAPIDSKKLQEKGVREKDKPSKIASEPKPKTVHIWRMCNVALADCKKLQEKGVGEKDQPRETIAVAKQNADHVCHLCNVACQTRISFESHLRGKKHASMLKQPEALADSKKLEENGVGEKDQRKEKIAEPQVQPQNAQENSKCFEKHVVIVNQSEALIDSKELQEKSVGEKEQPRETIVEPQNTCENSKCFGKHVSLLNQSEGLISSSKIEEKTVKEKTRPLETIPEPQSHSGNSQEHTKFSETQNEESRERCGSLESILKEPFPSSIVNKQKFSQVIHSWMTREKTVEEIERTDEEQGLKKLNDLRFQRAQASNDELKERNAISKSSKHAFTELKLESLLSEESRHPLDVILKLQQVEDVTEILKDESKHKLEPKSEEHQKGSAGLGEATREEETKGQVDNFWTRLLWGKKSG